MKTKEELEQIKNEYTELNKKLAELTDEELAQVSGGVLPAVIFTRFNPAIEPPVIEPPVSTARSAVSE